MKKLLPIIFFACVGSIFGQEYISHTFIKSLPKSFFQQNYGIFASYDVKQFRIKYTTVDVMGNPTVASGLVSIPDDITSGYPIAIYHHGTVGSRFEVPGYGSFEAVIPSIMSSLGFIGVAPDYLGLGDSPGLHPYVHAASQATASRDMLLALQKFLDTQKMNATKDLFITGYSQGGHAGMGFHRYLETVNNHGFKLKAATHMSGPYSISTGMKDLLLSEQDYSIVAYLANVALSYNLVYGIFPDNDLNKFFKPTYAKLVEQYAQEKINLWDMNTKMLDSLRVQYGKTAPKYMIKDEIVSAILTDNNHPVNVALRDNDVYDFKSTIPTRILYCSGDEQVAFSNSITAFDKMKLNGSPNLTLTNVKPGGTHTDCVSPAVTNTIFFFLQYLVLSNTQEDKFSQSLVMIYPNPSSNKIIIKSDSKFSKAKLVGISGTEFNFEVENNEIDIHELPKGLYLALLQTENEEIKFVKIVKE
jgi:hypothetical protein